ncbi:hypothetical protein OH76DRAFT_198329 [Lentinus brumalis]|uniref:Transmembrane protein n=1 Tax=Lentinus brumalis TaxID=2498619 RepID=A0A371DI62_9APHY|nr:hypothetical protein OH76DRAFT_198329 [Polyporus brumalis]
METFGQSDSTAQTPSSVPTSSAAHPTPVSVSASNSAAPPEIVAITAVCVFVFALCMFSAWYWARKRARRRAEAQDAVRGLDGDNMVEGPECDRYQSRTTDGASTDDTGSQAPLLHLTGPDTPDTASVLPAQSESSDAIGQPSTPLPVEEASQDEKSEIPETPANCAVEDGRPAEPAAVSADTEESNTPAVAPQSSKVPHLSSPAIGHPPDQEGVVPLRLRIPMDNWAVMVPAYATDEEMLLPPPAYSRAP